MTNYYSLRIEDTPQLAAESFYFTILVVSEKKEARQLELTGIPFGVLCNSFFQLIRAHRAGIYAPRGPYLSRSPPFLLLAHLFCVDH
jgi:hypothetical protein